MLRSGSTIALKLSSRSFWGSALWLSLWRYWSSSSTCPGDTFEGKKDECWAEVFEIYRLHGGGNINTGDLVGIYYPREQEWFSMWEGYGRKSDCPGRPNVGHGFEGENHHIKCWGEVFRVYAKGKRNGVRIKDGDTLAFYYVFRERMVEVNPSGTELGQCLLSTISNSQSNDGAFNNCKSETVTLKIFN